MRKRKGLYGLLVVALFSLILIAGCGGSGNTNTNNGGATDTPSTADNTPDTTPSGSGVVNVYTARHYEIDSQIFQEFTKQTGIQVNEVKGNAEELIERLRREGESTEADLFITVDGGVLDYAKQNDILQPVESEIVEQNVPAELRDKDNMWVGMATRARVIAYSKDRVNPEELSTYEDLASDKWKGKVLARSSTSLYNQSLLASLIELNGEEQAEQWAQGVVNNFAREPQGNDRDQAKAIVAGVGDVAIMNTYYVGLLLNSKDPEEVKVGESIGVFFPNQETTGTHRNISGIALTKHSKNKENAIKLIEFMTSKEAQTMLTQGNYEFPVNDDAELPELLQSWGPFKAQQIDFAKLGEHNKKAVEIFNKVGWK